MIVLVLVKITVTDSQMIRSTRRMNSATKNVALQCPETRKNLKHHTALSTKNLRHEGDEKSRIQGFIILNSYWLSNWASKLVGHGVEITVIYVQNINLFLKRMLLRLKDVSAHAEDARLRRACFKCCVWVSTQAQWMHLSSMLRRVQVQSNYARQHNQSTEINY